MPKAVRYTVLVKDGVSIPDWQIVFYKQAPFMVETVEVAEQYAEDLAAWITQAEYKVAEVHYEA